jgi:hypothetical protein
MIDNFAIALTHGLMLFIAWKMISMPAVDKETPENVAPRKGGWGR